MEISCIDDIEAESGLYFRRVIHSARYADPASEKRRRVENIALGRILIKDFRRFDLEARNGFQYLTSHQQQEIIGNRKRQARYDLQYGSLFPYEKMKLIKIVNKRVEGIYQPFVGWARAMKKAK